MSTGFTTYFKIRCFVRTENFYKYLDFFTRMRYTEYDGHNSER